MPPSMAKKRMARPLSAQPPRSAARLGAGAAGPMSVAVDMARLLVRRTSGGRGFRILGHGGRRGLHVHPDRLPDMTVEILEAAAVHEAIILLLAGLATAGSERLV